jgi:hypothetical protein
VKPRRCVNTHTYNEDLLAVIRNIYPSHWKSFPRFALIVICYLPRDCNSQDQQFCVKSREG